MSSPRVVSVAARWTIDDVLVLARGDAQPALPDDPRWSESIEKGARFVESLCRQEQVVYGVTTGYGASCDRPVPAHLVAELPANLVRYHGCGLGRLLDEEATAAVLAVRLRSLAQGWSGVRLCLLERLADLLARRILPAIPEEGSVGASGDLTPLSYVAAVIQGEREVLQHEDRPRAAAEALRDAGLQPLQLAPKEALAIMNGTSVMTALACLAWDRADRLARWGCRATSLAVLALRGCRGHFDERLSQAKPHPGLARAAAWIREDLREREDEARDGQAQGGDGRNSVVVQDRYSLRCAPHVLGVLWDALAWLRDWIETEVNSANDNPLFDAARGEVLHGGNFYGGHIAFGMDALKSAVASVADLLDRQLALLLDPHANRGLPANLSGASPQRLPISHGFKAVQIATSAWAAEALRLTMPAASFSRSTECHNQDKVSMGTIAARDALRVLELTEQVLAACLAAAAQGVALRIRHGELETDRVPLGLAASCRDVAGSVPLVVEDRALDEDLRHLLGRLRSRALVAAEPRASEPAEAVHA